MAFLATSTASTLVAYFVLACFLVVDPLTRANAAARSLKAGIADRGSTRVIGIAFALCIALLLSAPALDALPIGLLPFGAWFGWAGIVVMLAGLAVRLWAVLTLGAFFTRTLQVSEQQPIVREGPYRLVRHPGYLGDLLLWLGAAMATRNDIVLGCTALMLVIAYGYRIRREEAMLRTALGEPYAAYTAHTKRLIPFVF